MTIAMLGTPTSMLDAATLDARRLFGKRMKTSGASDPRSLSAERTYACPIRHGETRSVSRGVNRGTNRGAKQGMRPGVNRGAKQGMSRGVKREMNRRVKREMSRGMSQSNRAQWNNVRQETTRNRGAADTSPIGRCRWSFCPADSKKIRRMTISTQ